MKRAELKQAVVENTAEYRRYYRRYGDVYLYLMIWEDYMACLERARKACIHSPKERARGEVLDSWSIGANTFYKIHRLPKHLCDDVE